MIYILFSLVFFGYSCLEFNPFIKKSIKNPRCASTGSFFKYSSFYYFLFTKYFFISLNFFSCFSFLYATVSR